MTGKCLLLSACLFFAGISSYCQQWYDGVWTDGVQAFYPDSVLKNRIHFTGGTMHEGYGVMYCEKTGPNKLKILGESPDDASVYNNSSFGETGGTIEYKKLGEFEVMIAKDANGAFHAFALKIDQGFPHFFENNMINYGLAGKYLVKGSGKTVTFYPNERRVNWQGKDLEYEFKTEYDTPVEVIAVANHLYYYERKFTKLFLYETKEGDDYTFEKGRLLYTLQLTDTAEQKFPGVFGDYGFASRIPLTDDIVFSYSKDELKMIRNEIYARHGYIFTNPDVKKYFQSKKWYKPTQTDVFGLLSEIERLNIAQIKRAENRQDP